MKNTIPLVLAVLLGLAAVFAVNRTMKKATRSNDARIAVVQASSDIGKDKEWSGSIRMATIERGAYMPNRHILWDKRFLYDQFKAAHDIRAGAFILEDDIKDETKGQSSRMGQKEFMVGVKLQETPLTPYLKQYDEIAIAAMQPEIETRETGSAEDGKKTRSQYVTKLSVIFPRVRILEVSRGSVLVSAEPKMALKLLCASQTLPLYPLLRNKDDSENDYPGVGGSVSASDLRLSKLQNADDKAE